MSAAAPAVLSGIDLSVLTRRPAEVSRWLVATGVVLACAAVAPRHGGPDAAVMIAIFAAAAMAAVAGFAFSAIAGAMLFHTGMDAVQVVQVMMTCAIANQIWMVWTVRSRIDWRGLVPFLLGGLLGLPVGIWALLHVERAVFTQVLGAFLLIYGAAMMLVKPGALRWQSPILDIAVGTISGVTGGAAGFPGAPTAIWCGFKGWDATRQRALVQPFLLAMQIVGLLAITLLATHTTGTHVGSAAGWNPWNLACIPAGLLGTAVGLAIAGRMSRAQFARAVNVMLIVAGLGYAA